MPSVLTDYERYLRTRELSPTSIDGYLRTARMLGHYTQENYGVSLSMEDVPKLKGYMVSNWASAILPLKVATRRLYVTTANAFLGYLYSMQYVDFDLRTALPKPPNIERYNRTHPDEFKPKRDYTPDEIQRMFAATKAETFSGARNIAMLAVLLTTGLRVSEMAALNVGDVRNCTGFVRVPRKGTNGNPVPVALPPEILPTIERYLRFYAHYVPLKDDTPLFGTKNGRRMSRREIYGCLQRIQKRVGVPTGVHTFRHTAITNAAKHADPIVARDVAGQKSVSITNRYMHSSDEDKLRAVLELASLLPKLQMDDEAKEDDRPRD